MTAYSSNLKMEAIYSSKMSVNFYWTTWHHILEDTAFQCKEYLPLQRSLWTCSQFIQNAGAHVLSFRKEDSNTEPVFAGTSNITKPPRAIWDFVPDISHHSRELSASLHCLAVLR
jgi:hypothetical protein